MAEYIERKELQAEIIKRLGISDEKHLLPAERTLWSTIADIPAADVQPVVHGEWIWEEPNSANRFRGCFLCNKCFESVYAKKNYCPNCGADMRGEEDDK